MARLVLLHGFTQGPRSWGAVTSQLTGHDLVPLALPGHAGNPPAETTFEEAAAGLAEVGGRGVWVGYSMGGRLALRVALDRPDLVDGLVLLGANPGLADPDERAARRRVDETLAAGLERQGVERFMEGWLRLALFKRLPPEAAGLEERRRNTVEGLAAALRRHGTGAQEPVWDRLSQLRMPVLLMAGEHDSHYVSVAFDMAAAIGETAAVSIVPGAGHAAHLERPEAFAVLLERFVARHHGTE
jgi:2-succinyl-6-hydroxy-2,4-cyclohexadiene-1-carboxylate synthase